MPAKAAAVARPASDVDEDEDPPLLVPVSPTYRSTRAAFNSVSERTSSLATPIAPTSSAAESAEDAYADVPQPKTGTGYPMNPHPQLTKGPPAFEEPFHPVRENLISEMLVHDAERLANPQAVLNRVVYDCIEPNPAAYKAGSAGTAPPAPAPGTLPVYYRPESPSDSTLVFESRFECGNLRRAIQVYEHEYDLILRPDINTRGHTQWYYFRLENMKHGQQYKFNVINLVKPDSLYNYGMQPVVYSEQEAERDDIGWQRRGTNACYYQNHIKRRQGAYYTLTFNLDCKYDGDTVYVAYCYPYSFTDLQAYLAELQSDPKRRNRFRRRELCQTLAGNPCDLLTITSFMSSAEAIKARKGVVISARVHPGETNASWMMKGFIDYLTGPSLDAKILRDNFVFKIVPMLNPDGVINGNYRCSLAGCDLNRQWSDPSKKLNPTIWSLKQMIRKFMDDREVVMYCDLHGHSRKKNVFMYGCEQAQSSGNRLKERIFPRLLSKNADVFSFGDCCFKVQKSKESCSRVVVSRELGLIYSYTMEASFSGANFGRYSDQHFTSTHLEEMGHYFCDTILDFCDPDQTKVNSVKAELDLLYPPKHSTSNAEKVAVEDSDDSDSGSDSGDEKKGKKKGKAKFKSAATKAKGVAAASKRSSDLTDRQYKGLLQGGSSKVKPKSSTRPAPARSGSRGANSSPRTGSRGTGSGKSRTGAGSAARTAASRNGALRAAVGSKSSLPPLSSAAKGKRK